MTMQSASSTPYKHTISSQITQFMFFLVLIAPIFICTGSIRCFCFSGTLSTIFSTLLVCYAPLPFLPLKQPCFLLCHLRLAHCCSTCRFELQTFLCFSIPPLFLVLLSFRLVLFSYIDFVMFLVMTIPDVLLLPLITSPSNRCSVLRSLI